MEDTSAAIYSEAKSEYTKQLVFNFQPVLLRFFLDRYTEAKASPSVSSKTKSALSEFQDSLSQIPEWNLDKVQRETSSLLQAIHCDYIEDLITAVFIAHTKILSAIRLHAKPRRRIQITVPKPDHFMHRALSECSRILWSNVYLFSDTVSSLDRQKNTNDVNRFLEDGILQAIRNLLPVKSILRDSLQDDDDDAVQITNLNDTPIVETSVVEAAAIEPVIETAVVEAVVVETPVVQTPVVESETGTSENADVKSVDIKPVESQVVQVNKEVPSETNSLVVDTERSVGFTGMDSVFGLNGDAEIRPMIEENNDQFQILGDSEQLDVNEFEDLDNLNTLQSPVPLGADDYESL